MAARGAASKRLVAMASATGTLRLGLAEGLVALAQAQLPMGPAVQGVAPIIWSRTMHARGRVAPAFLSLLLPRVEGGAERVVGGGGGCVAGGGGGGVAGGVYSGALGSKSVGSKSACVKTPFEFVCAMVRQTAGGADPKLLRTTH